MIHIRVREKDNRICEIEIHGHADSAEYGKDLVCAAVSSIAFGLCNALDEMADMAGFEIDENRIRIYLTRPDATAEIILRTGLIQFETVAETQSKYIQIETEE